MKSETLGRQLNPADCFAVLHEDGGCRSDRVILREVG